MGRITTVTVVVIIVFTMVYHFSPAGRQQRNLNIARDHADLIRPQIESDARFASVDVFAYTGDGGVLGVVGRVASTEDLNALRQLVATSNPPLDVKWNTQVIELLIETDQ